MGHPEVQDTHLDSWVLKQQTHLLILLAKSWHRQYFCIVGQGHKISRCWFKEKEARVAREEVRLAR